MSKPERQHFIPRSYLNNFAVRAGDKYFIHGKRFDTDKIVSLSTKDICVDKNLYTIPTADGGKKFDIEHFYADKVDSVFPEIYSILKNRHLATIDFDIRLKVIITALSLYFRTPKFLNIQNRLFESIVSKNLDSTNEKEIAVSLFGEEIRIKRDEAEEVIQEKKDHNRIKFLFQHLQSYEKFVQSKLLDNMAVYHIDDDSEFITSDNPVIIRPHADPTKPEFNYTDYYSQVINPFDKTNMIHLPVDNKTILTILPATKESVSELFQRLDIGVYDVIMYNSDIEKYSENWILGSKTGIEKHIQDQQTYNVENGVNLELMEKYKNKVIALKQLVELMELHGSTSDQVKEKIIKMKSNPYISADINFQKMAQQIEQRN